MMQLVAILALAGPVQLATAAPGLAQQAHATETRALGMAVSSGNAEQVRLLLSQGANPLAGMPSALERALYVTASGAAYKRGSRLPPHAGVMVPLLLNHIVKVQKVALASIRWKPLELALQDAAESDDDADVEGEADNAARVRLLVAAGFSPRSLSEAAAAAALAIPDKGLASELLDRGMLRMGPAQARSAATAKILLTAVAWRRADLLPRLLELGYDPNLRSGNNPSPVELAIQLGAQDELDALLAGGGRVESEPGQPAAR
jgi:ankyrin repeat protein